MSDIEIHGTCPSALAGVKDAFAANFAAGEEIGARFTLCEDGEVVLDIWAGAADRAREKPFDDKTVTTLCLDDHGNATVVGVSASLKSSWRHEPNWGIS